METNIAGCSEEKIKTYFPNKSGSKKWKNMSKVSTYRLRNALLNDSMIVPQVQIAYGDYHGEAKPSPIAALICMFTTTLIHRLLFFTVFCLYKLHIAVVVVRTALIHP